jgi:4-hydroxy-3-polyprenylbenzoate decarboxylase
MRPDLLAAFGGSLRAMPILSSRENSPAAQTSALEFLKLSIPLRLRHTGDELRRPQTRDGLAEWIARFLYFGSTGIGYAGRMDLSRFIDILRSRSELLELESEIDGRLELAALTDLFSKSAGAGLLFPWVKGTDLSFATNLLGSDQRMAAALGHADLASFGRGLTEALVNASGSSSAQRFVSLLQRIETEDRTTARISREPSLGILPDLRYWPAEECSFLTLAVVISRAPQSGLHNYGLYRVGVVDDRRLTLNLLPGSGAGRHLEQWRAAGKSMPVAILLGADPALLFAAAAPLPSSCSEEAFSALLNRTSFQSSPCRTIPLNCPTSGQLLIEGWVDPESSLNEGPFGCFSGDYGGSNDCPLVEISALSMVDEPLIPLTLAGPLPMEDCWIARANLEIFRARLAVDLPEIGSIEMPLEAAFHGLYFIRCHDTAISAADLAQKLRGLDYPQRIKMLVLLGETDEAVSESGWRELIGKLPAERIWTDPAADLGRLLNNQAPSLQADTRLQKKLLARLGLDADAISTEKGIACNRK